VSAADERLRSVLDDGPTHCPRVQLPDTSPEQRADLASGKVTVRSADIQSGRVLQFAHGVSRGRRVPDKATGVHGPPPTSKHPLALGQLNLAHKNSRLSQEKPAGNAQLRYHGAEANSDVRCF
jgi:hypothetical protein